MKTVLNKILISFGFVSALLANEPYDSMRVLAYEPYFIPEGYILLDKVNSQGTTAFIDIKSPNGAAARYIAANTNDTVKVYSINAWENDYAFHKFLSNVKQENQNEKIIPIRMNAQGAADAVNLVSEFIYIDAYKCDTLYDNILAWVTHLSEHGIIGGNLWEKSSVELAVVKAAADLNLSLSNYGTYWFLKND